MLKRASEIPVLLQQKSSNATISNSSKIPPLPSTTSTATTTNNGVIMTTTVVKDYDQETGNKLINNFMIIKEIGRGVHGKVKLAQDLEMGELVAIKIVDKKNRRRQMGYSLLRGNQHNTPQQKEQQQQHFSKENELKIRREISILEKCCHPNVVKLREVIDDPASRKIYMALEYTECGEIEWRDEYDEPVMTINEARRIFRDIVNGLDYLHYQGIIHRDIKPANLLLSHDRVAKISDFGVSYYNELLSSAYSNTTGAAADTEMLNRIDRELAETAGTPAFFAPELCCAGGSSNNSEKPRISKAIDVWALGVTLYCFIFGICPFIAATEFELFDTIPSQPLTFPANADADIEDGLKDLLKKLLTKNPDYRITLDQVKRHPWVTADLKNPEEWITSTDPQRYITAQQQQHSILPTELQHITESVTMMDRLRQSIRKLSFSFGGSSSNSIDRRKSSSATSAAANMTNKQLLSSNNNRPISYQHPTTTSTPNVIHHNNPNNMHRLSQPTMSKQPSYSTSLLPHTTSSVTPTVSLSTGHTFIFNSKNNSNVIPTPTTPSNNTPLHPLRPISTSYLSDEEDTDYYEEEGEQDQPRRISTTSSRPDISRRVSSASSNSGLGLTFGRYRGGGMTPMEAIVPPTK